MSLNMMFKIFLQMHSQERMRMWKHCFVHFYIQPEWITEARDEWKNDEEVWTLIQNLQQDFSTSDTFSWKKDSLWYKDRLYLCNNSQLNKIFLLESHTPP